MDKIDVKALAKINIGLDVTGIRDDVSRLLQAADEMKKKQDTR